jgi:D-alanyl-D-alanine carboxypeptidase
MSKEISEVNDSSQGTNFSSVLSTVLENSNLPQHISIKILENIAGNPAFILDLFSILQEDPYLWVLVDKKHSLAENYEPDDLIELTNSTYLVNRNGLFLRKTAVESLEEMAAAARKEGITLVASSAYRSYSYQVQVYERNVAQMGKEAADRESARAGHSQHQLGLVIDFGSITDAFAKTPQGIWLAANASRFGWSLSFPDGYEEITGYRWESWHYRYVGKELAEFIDNYFDGIQQYALRFIHEWTTTNPRIDH